MSAIKKDHFIFGVALGFLIPGIVFGFVLLINFLLIQTSVAHGYLNLKIHMLISIAVNLLPLRYYFVSLKFDRTGRGLLLVTFIMMILFFVLNDRIL